VTLEAGGQSSTISFNDRCDGTYDPGSLPLASNFVSISLRLNATWETMVEGGSKPSTYESVWTPRWYARGAFSGSRFNGTISPDIQGGNATGSVEAEIHPTTKEVLWFSARATDISDWVSEWRISGRSLPLISLSNSGLTLENRLEGAELCATTHPLAPLYAGSSAGNLRTEKLTGFDCSAPGTQLAIRFTYVP
jgi:hypothetical protein